MISNGSDKRGRLDRFDKIGSFFSSACAVHCLCMPVLLGLLPALGASFIANPTVERSVAVTMIVFALACVWSGCRYHRQWGLLALLGAGSVLILFAQFGETGGSEWFEAGLMVIGGSIIASSHIFNRKLRARCHCIQCEPAATKNPQSPRN